MLQKHSQTSRECSKNATKGGFDHISGADEGYEFPHHLQYNDGEHRVREMCRNMLKTMLKEHAQCSVKDNLEDYVFRVSITMEAWIM